MAVALPSVAPLRASLQRFRHYLEVACQDHLGADALHELLRHVDAVLMDLETCGARQDESTRARVSTLRARMEASDRATILDSDGDLKREANMLLPLLAAHMGSSRVGGAA